MSSMLANKEHKGKTYFKLTNLIKKQDNVINKLLVKHNTMISEKNEIIENQYQVIQEQSKNIESLIRELDKVYTGRKFLNRLKSFIRLKDTTDIVAV